MSSPKKEVSKGSPKEKSLSDKSIEKSPNDKLNYKVINLDNGLKAVLVSDPTYAKLTDNEPTPKRPEKKDRSRSRSPTTEGSSGSESGKRSGRGGKRGHRGVKGQSRRSRTTEKLSAVTICVRSGSFCDPREVQGMAHLVEHCITMGSKKFPEENALDEYLTSKGGDQNAHTEYEYTMFEVEVQRKHLYGALERLAACFTEPLLKADSISRETRPVNTEFKEAKNDDDVRFEQILCNLANKDHPLNTFAWGNEVSLKTEPKKNGIDTHKLVKDFVEKHYKSDNIHIVIQSQEPMETLDKWVRSLFGSLKSNKSKKSSEKSEKKFGLPFDNNPNLNKYYLVQPMSEMDQLSILWCLPPINEHFKTCPLDYWGHVIGHEGKGSLVSGLRKDNLALELTAGVDTSGFHNNKYSSIFVIQIRLTDSGRKKLDTIVEYVFEYIQMLRKVGPQEWFFKELQQIENNRFNWVEEMRAIDHAKKIAIDLMYCSDNKYLLRGFKPFVEYKADVIKSYIDLMTPQKACFLRQCSNCIRSKDKDFKTEKWFGTKYKVSEVPKEWLKGQTSESKRFHFPEPNPYIAKKFEIKKPKDKTDYPTKVVNESRLKLWYKPDDKFKFPKAIIKLHLISEQIWKSVENAVIIDLFCDALSQTLSEDTYAATMADLDYSVSTTVVGLTVTVGGFDDKLDLLLETIIEKILKFDVTDKVFSDVKKNLSKSYNNDFIDQTNLNKAIRLSILSKIYYTSLQKRAIISAITKDQTKNLLSKLFKEFYIESLIQGNLTQEESINLMKKISQKFGITSQLPAIEEPKLTTREIPIGNTFCRVLALTKTNVNSSVTNYIQLQPANIKLHCLLAIMSSVTEEPCFNVLRTKEGLGYHVWAADYDTYGISGFGVSVSSSGEDFHCSHIDQRIESFMKYMSETFLKNMKEETFKEHIKSLITLKKVPDLQLAEEFNRNWTEIISFNYCFDHLEKEVKLLEKITFDEFKEWANTETLKSNQKKRKLSVQVVGYAKKSLEECQTFDGKPVQYERQSSSEMDSESDGHHSDSNRKDSEKKRFKLTHLKPKSGQKSDDNYIEAIDKFVDKLKMFGVHKVVE